MSLITLENIQKYYNKNKPSEVHALKGVSLTLEKGETVALMGVSGCGKSTLLSIIGCMSRPDSGRYLRTIPMSPFQAPHSLPICAADA